MQGLTLLCRLTSIVGVAVICAAFAGGRHVYVSPKYGYQLMVPSGWNIAIPPSGVPVLFNYAQDRALPQGLIPDGGAEIYLIPYDAISAVVSVKNTEAWIAANSANWHTSVRRRKLPNWTNDPASPQQITRVDAEYKRAEEGEDLQSEVNYYFFLRGSAYRLRLLYGKGEPRASKFESVMGAVLHSIKAR